MPPLPTSDMEVPSIYRSSQSKPTANNVRKRKATNDSQDSNSKAKRKFGVVPTWAKVVSRSAVVSLDAIWKAVVVDASNKHIQTIENNPPCLHQIRADSLDEALKRLIPKVMPKEATDKLSSSNASPVRGIYYIPLSVDVHATCGTSLYKKVLQRVSRTSEYTAIHDEILRMWESSNRIEPVELLVTFHFEESRPLASNSATAQVRSGPLVQASRDDFTVVGWRNEVAIANETTETSPVESQELVRVEHSSSPSAHKDVELRAYFDKLKSTVKDEAWKADYETAYEVACRERFTV